MHTANPKLTITVAIAPARHVSAARRNLPTSSEAASSSPAAERTASSSVLGPPGAWWSKIAKTSTAEPKPKSAQKLSLKPKPSLLRKGERQSRVRGEHAARIMPAQRHDHHFVLSAVMLVHVFRERLPACAARRALRHRRA